jgi:hypothetical protein
LCCCLGPASEWDSSTYGLLFSWGYRHAPPCPVSLLRCQSC